MPQSPENSSRGRHIFSGQAQASVIMLVATRGDVFLDDFASATPRLDAAEAENADACARFAKPGPALARPHLQPVGCGRPFDLLLAEQRGLSLVGREEELAALTSWLDAPGGFSARWIVGRPGTGKTRLALELCERAEGQGWWAGFLAPETVASEASRGRRVLAVVDRAGAQMSASHLTRLAGQPPSEGKLRVLVLDRSADQDWCAELVRMGVPVDPPEPVRLGGLRSAADRDRLLRQALAHAARLSGEPVPLPPSGAALDTGEPLHLVMAALLAPQYGVEALLAEPPARLAGRLAAQELARLERWAGELCVAPAAVTHIAAVITLQDGCRIDGLRALVEEEGQHLHIAACGDAGYLTDCLIDMLAGADGARLPAMGPDLIGEAVVIRALVRHPPDVQAGIIERALRRDPFPVSEMLRRIQRDHASDDPSRLAFEWSQHMVG